MRSKAVVSRQYKRVPSCYIRLTHPNLQHEIEQFKKSMEINAIGDIRNKAMNWRTFNPNHCEIKQKEYEQ